MTLKAYNTYFKRWLSIVAEYEGYDGKLHYMYGPDTIQAFADLLNKRVKNQHQNNILYVGETGGGKSTMAINVCKAQEKDWSITDNYIYTVEDLKKKYSDPDKYSRISLIDEASIVINALDFNTKGSKAIVGLMDTMRSQGMSTHMCAPDEMEINTRVKTIHVDFLIRMPAKSHLYGVEKRGQADIYRHVRSDWGHDSWQLMASCIFPDLLPRWKKEYLPIKAEKQAQIRKQFASSD